MTIGDKIANKACEGEKECRKTEAKNDLKATGDKILGNEGKEQKHSATSTIAEKAGDALHSVKKAFS